MVLAGVYLWPVPRRDFEDLSARVPPEIRLSLLEFRQHYPPQRLNSEGRVWEYVALGEGPETVLFLHGMAGAYDIWWQQMEALAPDFRVLSLTYAQADSLAALADGVLAILAAEAVEVTNVVGSSLGGYLAQYLMATQPQRLRRVVLGNTFPPNEELARRNASLIRVLPWLPAWAVMRFFRRSFEQNIYPAADYSELVLAYLLEQAYGRMSKAQILGRARAVVEHFAPPDPAALGIPLLIIEADNDPLVPEKLREQLKTAYPSAQVHTLHAAGHFPYLNRPEAYTRILREFLATPV
ncbi:MAG: alpha/beta hydrolase [Caldilineae bacterium]|nr:MAG: alpha/beta hydrolase [Caldilineae bacterium]